MTDWLFYAALALAVMGWATAFGLYLQARDALKLAETWREIGVMAVEETQRERHLSEFAVRAMDPFEPDYPTLADIDNLKGERQYLRRVPGVPDRGPGDA